MQIAELREHIKSLPAAERKDYIMSLSPDLVMSILYNWEFWARPKQLPPKEWLEGKKRFWVLCGGRGSGKTRAGSETTRMFVANGWAKSIGLVAKTPTDARKVMIEDVGEGAGSGLLQIYPPGKNPKFQPGNARLLWEKENAVANIFSGEVPDGIRGFGLDFVWIDELSKFKYPEATWHQILLAFRHGTSPPRGIITMTPRSIKIVRDLLDRPDVIVTTENTYANRANLAADYFEQVETSFKGTHLYRQEIEGLLIEDHPEALWARQLIEDLRVKEYPKLRRIAVAVDPPTNTAECGIVAGGVGEPNYDGQYHGYLLKDHSLSGSPKEWGEAVIQAYKMWEADMIIAEKNQGGEMVRYTIESVAKDMGVSDQIIPVELVDASRDKYTRAEPVSLLYQRKLVHHVGNEFPELEDQMCTWVKTDKDSPDRLDANVWLWHGLLNADRAMKIKRLKSLVW